MPAIIDEKWDSRPATVDFNLQSAGVDLGFHILGTTEDLEVHALVRANLPMAYYIPNPQTGEPVAYHYQSYAIERKGWDVWEAVGRYVPFTQEAVWTADTAGETAHITQSKGTVLSVYNGDVLTAAPDFRGAINVTDSEVGGVDIPVASLAMTATIAWPRLLFTPEYQAVLYGMSSTVNDAPFRGLLRGDVLFRGANWEDRSGSPFITVTYKFMYSPSKENIEIGLDEGGLPELIVAFKEGWQLLWIRYQDRVDATAKFLVKRPVAAYVEKVYDYADFSLLGLGT